MKTYKFKLIVLLFFIFNAFFLYSEEQDKPYKIRNIYYYSNGKTKVSAFKRKIEIDINTIYNNKADFEKYLADLTQEIINLRLLDEINVTYETVSFEEEINIADVSIMFSDTKNMLVLPKPSYNSNTGFELKVKMKDNNFLGLLNTFNFDFNGSYALDKLSGDKSAAFGINCSYDYPFIINNFNISWDNDVSFKWTLGHDKPEFSYETGFTLSYPVGKTSIDFKLHESIIRDEEYFKYNDEFYFKNLESISLPITLTKIKHTKLVYTPSIEFSFNSDSDGINPENYDLSSPLIIAAQQLSYSKIDWIGNMRKGLYFNIKNPYGWNFQKSEFITGASLETQFFACSKIFSFSSRIYAFAYKNDMEKIGDKIRGVLDNQIYIDSHQYALRTDTAFVINFDMPVHIITTDWYGWGYKLFGAYEDMSKAVKVITLLPYKLFKIADFELQLSPFADAALLNNSSTGRLLDLKDGFYSAGVEILIYPAKWKSFVVRASLGYDLGRKFFPSSLDNSWRDDVSTREFSFGLGLHY